MRDERRPSAAARRSFRGAAVVGRASGDVDVRRVLRALARPLARAAGERSATRVVRRVVGGHDRLAVVLGVLVVHGRHAALPGRARNAGQARAGLRPRRPPRRWTARARDPPGQPYAARPTGASALRPKAPAISSYERRRACGSHVMVTTMASSAP